MIEIFLPESFHYLIYFYAIYQTNIYSFIKGNDNHFIKQPQFEYEQFYANKFENLGETNNFSVEKFKIIYALKASSTATATATVAPTMGLLPIPIRPIIST